MGHRFLTKLKVFEDQVNHCNLGLADCGSWEGGMANENFLKQLSSSVFSFTEWICLAFENNNKDQQKQ